ncbi:MAG TPA: hypothetical protein VNX47_06975 [Nevskia sp.]|nr:hypothetical protein [Nevskia sp.]
MERNHAISRFPEAPADSQGLVHQGLGFTRAARGAGPASRREMQFAHAWQRENLREPGLTGALDAILRAQDEAGLASRDTPRPVPLDQHSATVAATTMQWLGTTQGFQFLADVLEAAGYKLVDATTGTVQNAGARFERCKRESIRERYTIDAVPNIVEGQPIRYHGTIDGITISTSASCAEQAMNEAVSSMLSGAVIEQLAVRLTACATGYAARQASPEQVVRYADKCLALAGKALADLDVRAAEQIRGRLHSAIAEWRRHNPAQAEPMRKVA